MSYVLVYNNYVINGPRSWNYRSFESTLEEELELSIKLPMQKTDQDAIIIDENTKILYSVMEYPTYNAKIEYLDGPYWTFDNNIAYGSYEIKPNDINAVKSSLISEVAAVRYEKESAGAKTIIQGIEVTIDTARGNRDIFVQKYLLMSENDIVNWKFPEAWLALSKSDLGQAVAAGAAHIQTQFDWEQAKVNEINSCETLESLDAIIIREPLLNQILV